MATTTMRRSRRSSSGALGSLRHDPAAPYRHLDWVLIAAVLIIAGVGLLMVFSTSRGANPPYYYSQAAKQLLFVVLGIVAAAIVVAIDYRHFRDWAPFIYGAGLALLLFVLSPFGSSHKGSQSWIDLGMFQLQPSEIGKVTFIIGIAGLAAHYRGEPTLARVAALLAVSGVPIVLVLAQGDLGTALVFVAMVPTILWIGGTKGRYLVVLAVLAVVVGAAIVTSGALKQYQTDRLTVFVTQTDTGVAAAHSQGAAYNLDQAKIAIGHGGLWGRGLFNGSQTRTGQVPEQDTDFIFTALAEQFGFVGAASMLAVMGVVVIRVWRTAQLARDDFGAYLCAGVLAMFLFQIFENVGMTMGIMPITGIPLPFMSYGGSSSLANFVAVGLVLNVHARRF
ncbi:MAG TPA: rod shape-determining protein RodA, partial [Acidimicrobiales bacterium]|nr:rod shape-determining protein RodA [Acidimicrobiales bacterium]